MEWEPGSFKSALRREKPSGRGSVTGDWLSVGAGPEEGEGFSVVAAVPQAVVIHSRPASSKHKTFLDFIKPAF